MREIQYKSENNRTYMVKVDKFPSFCGICQKNVDPIYIGIAYPNENRKSYTMQTAFQCTNIECSSIIIGQYSREHNGDTDPFHFEKSGPLKPVDKEFNEEISSVSSNFVEIYNQSYYAEQNDLTLISGIGYRKAIEFLIKDYLIYLDEENQKEILRKPLGQCVNMLDNNNIKEIAKRATWIGNDEAHYVRKWEGKDIEDLKKLIDVTVYFIAMNVASKKYLAEMS